MTRMALPALSIVTPSFNQGEFIETTIRSVLDQGYPRLEYLVMDGGSTDGTLAILRRYQDRLTWTSGRDGGQGAALNEGFRRTRGDVIGWINSDDVYDPDAFRTVAEYFAEHPEVEWLYGRCPIIDGAGRVCKRWITRYKEFWMRRFSYRRLLIENYIPQPAVFFRRRLLERVGAIDVSYQHAFDYHLWLRLGAVSAPVMIDRVLACFRVHDSSKTSAGYYRSFTEELEAARRVAAGRHPVLIWLHEVNRIKLLTAYYLLARLPRANA